MVVEHAAVWHRGILGPPISGAIRNGERRLGAKMDVELVNDGPVTIVLDA